MTCTVQAVFRKAGSSPRLLCRIDGVMPTLISWSATHPTNAMNDLGVSLTHVDLQHPEASRLNALWRDLGAQQDSFVTSEAGISVQLTTPKGQVTLSS